MHAYLYQSNNIGHDTDFSKLLHKDFVDTRKYNVQTIEEVRSLKKALVFPPQQPTLYVLSSLDLAKAEAQNAILKLLEEPPNEFVTFLLLVTNEHTLLPTIFSRVQRLENIHVISVTKNILSTDPKTWFATLSKITDREEAIETLNAVIEGEYTVFQKEAALYAIEALRKNGNVTLHLTNFVLHSLYL